MQLDGSDSAGERAGGFDYYMLRLARSAGAPPRLTGLVERLGTGEKRSFQSAEELLQLVAQWSAPENNMPIGKG